MKRIISSILVMMMVLALAACGSKDVTETVEAPVVVDETETAVAAETEEPVEKVFDNRYPSFIVNETETAVTYLDKFGTETTVTKMPKKTVVLYNSILGLWYYMGGESLTKVKGSTNVPEEAMDLDDLGSSYSVSLEAVIAYEPDLVILAGNIDSQVAMSANLHEMGIETMIVDVKTRSYERFTENAYLFSKILGTEDMYARKTAHVIEEVDTIIATATAAEERPLVAPLFATTKNMTLETDVAQIGEIVAMLGGENIYTEADLVAEGETRIPFSIEALVTKNPEVILISTMGNVDGCKAYVDSMIEENPVWYEVDAVKNERVFYLDKSLSVYKPNQRYAEAFQMVAEMIYPALFAAE